MPRPFRTSILLVALTWFVGLPVGFAAPDDDKDAETARSPSPETRAIISVHRLDGTPLEPILLECRGDFVIVQPAGIRISKDELASPEKSDNPLVVAVRNSLKSRAHAESDQSAAGDRYYPLLLVRPDGILVYYQAREALAAGQQQVGVELVEQHWTLEAAGPVAESLPPPAQVAKPTTIIVEHVARPYDRVPEGEELHFQLKGNRVATVPMTEFVKIFAEDAQLKVVRLLEVSEVKQTLGPVAGFSMEYFLRRDNSPGARAALFCGFVLTPQSVTLGEALAQALEPNSEFRQALQAADRERVTVTLWTYPDSFTAWRAIRNELQQLGYTVGSRPLPESQPIGASSDASATSK